MAAELAAAVSLAAGVAAIAFVHLRHAALTALVLAAPLPGLALGAVAATVLHGNAPWAAIWLACALGGLLQADAAIRGFLDGGGGKEAARAALRLCAGPVLLAALAGALALVGMAGFAEAIWPGIGQAAVLLLGAASTVALLAAAGMLSFDEDFIVRANRIREWEQRQVDHLIAAARPRWGQTLSGIALVFTAIAGFGLPSLSPEILPLAVAVAAFFACAFAAIRDLRATAAALLAWMLAGLTGLWGLALTHTAFTTGHLTILLAVLTAGAVLLLFVGATMGRYGRADDDATIASGRFLARDGAGLAAAGAALLVGAGLWAVAEGNWGLIPAVPFAAAGPLLFQPAFAVAIETLLPRAATLAARYRLR